MSRLLYGVLKCLLAGGDAEGGDSGNPGTGDAQGGNEGSENFEPNRLRGHIGTVIL